MSMLTAHLVQYLGYGNNAGEGRVDNEIMVHSTGKDETIPFAAGWMEMQDCMVSIMCQKNKDKYRHPH